MTSTDRTTEPRSPSRRPPAPFGSAASIGRLFGVQIYLDVSLAIIFFLIASTLGLGTFPAWHPEWSALTTWTVAIVAAVAFFASILAHELSHALVGRALGVEVRGITLFMFGGVASMAEESRSPRAEFLMTIVGPLTSLAIGVGGVMVGASLTAANAQLLETNPEGFLQALGPVASLFIWLGPVNILLAAFNMIPGFPLDGGRVLRAFIWWLTGDLHKATLWASRTGQGFAFLMIGVGVFMALGGYVPVLGGGLLNGLWLVLIGWFLAKAAQAGYAQLLRREVLSGTPVRRIMRGSVPAVSTRQTVAELVEGPIMHTDLRSFPVYDEANEWVGLVTVARVREVPKAQWDSVTLSDIMIPRGELATVGIDTDAEAAFQELIAGGREQLPVVENGEIRGFLRREDVMKWLMLHQSPRHA